MGNSTQLWNRHFSLTFAINFLFTFFFTVCGNMVMQWELISFSINIVLCIQLQTFGNLIFFLAIYFFTMDWSPMHNGPKFHFNPVSKIELETRGQLHFNVGKCQHPQLPNTGHQFPDNNNNNPQLSLLRRGSHIKSDYAYTIIKCTLLTPYRRHMHFDFQQLCSFCSLPQPHPTPLQVIFNHHHRLGGGGPKECRLMQKQSC